jgi:hypothetical protein
MKLFAHGSESEVVSEHDVESGISVAALRDEIGADEAALVWLEEGEEPLNPDHTLAQAGVAEFAHVHHGHNRTVEVTVRFGGESKERHFPPSATVNRAFAWAVGNDGFDLPAAQRSKHTLGLCGSQAEVDRRIHVDSLAAAGRVCFDLAPKVRYQG